MTSIDESNAGVRYGADEPLPNAAAEVAPADTAKITRRNNISHDLNNNNAVASFDQLHSSARTDLHIAQVDELIRGVAFGAVGLYLIFVVFSFQAGIRGMGSARIESLEGIERTAPLFAAVLLGTSISSSFIPMVYRTKKGERFTGVMIAGFVVQFLAFTTNVMLCTLPVPVIIDPMTGMRVFLLRWSEWTPLAFVMTFLTEACRADDVKSNNNNESSSNVTCCHEDEKTSLLTKPDPSNNNGTATTTKNNNSLKGGNGGGMLNHRSTYLVALSQCLSAFCGYLFPFIENFVLRWITMTVSCLLFFVIYYRLYKRWFSYHYEMKAPGSSLAEQEIHRWAKLSLGLLSTCAALWTFLVIAYFVYSFGPLLAPENSLLKTKGIVMICECFIDVLFKSMYLVIIVDVHKTIFDPNARVNRRLEELRQMMNTVWENSSDVIALSKRKPTGDVMTLFSPTFLKLHSEKKGNDDDGNGGLFLDDSSSIKNNDPNNSVGAAIELEAKYFSAERNEPIVGSSRIQPTSVYEVEFGGSKKFSNEGHFLGNVPPKMKKRTASVDELQPISELVVKAWQETQDVGESQSILHDLVWSSSSSTPTTDDVNNKREHITCEANITRLEENALVIVARNVSERVRRFEAEKKAVAETTARVKDAAANRFTRHEVKNGLLAAIGLCDSLKEVLLSSNKGSGDDEHQHHHQGNILVTEMDKTLHEVLETVLAEAMARDVIHDVYEPKFERIDIVQLIQSTMKHATAATASSSSSSSAVTCRSDRFPLRTEPTKFPIISTDPQLLKYIHRNAMSNACKYGERGGKVLTEIILDESTGAMCINVINLPGKNHDEIVKLGSNASDIVFSPSRRLPMHVTNSETSVSHSSGDGAWVMLKCASTLGGDCEIKFLEDKTILSFRCVTSTPSSRSDNNASNNDDNNSNCGDNKKEFKLPSNLHAIAIDDSKIQRKLLARYFTYAGLSKDQVTILGDTTKSITEFEHTTHSFIENHPSDYILLVVDENLDVYEDLKTSDVTISGSMLVSNIRRKLLPDDERRMLALIRSANDSADDVAIYNSRAHGYLPKSPIKPGKVLDGLAPHWLSRFPACYTPSSSKIKCGTPEAMLPSSEHDNELAMATDYLKECITTISKLMLSLTKDENEKKEKEEEEKSMMNNNWILISEKLHLLKGDLLTLSSNNHNLSTAIDIINDMRGPKVPPNAPEKWEHLKSILFGGLI